MMKFFQSRSKCDLDSGGATNHDHYGQHLVKLQEKVFQSPLILEVILMHSLQPSGSCKGGGQLCTREARKLRLVSKFWLLQINYLFQRHGESMVSLSGRNLKQFLEITDSCDWGAPPPISLSLGPKALVSNDFCEDLNKLFGKEYLVEKLTSLKISDPHIFMETQLAQKFHEAAIGLPDFPSDFKLANLRRIMLKQLHPARDLPENIGVRIPRLEEFVRQILGQSEILDEFRFEGGSWLECPPGRYEGLTLPGGVSRVQLDTRMNLGKMLGMKRRGGGVLEGIRVLNLSVTTRNLFGEGEMEGILEGVRMSLEHLELDFRDLTVLDLGEVVLKFPVMERLKRMRVGGILWRVERSQVLNGLGDRFPKLEELEFRDFSDELLLDDWCGENSVFGCVTNLMLQLVPEMWTGAMVGMPERKMRRILSSFPNVEKLKVESLDVGNMEGVRYMFGELGGQLRSLHLDFKGFLEREEEMEGILIGGDVEMMRRLKGWLGREKAWEEFLEGGNGGEHKSLRDLINLEELVLNGYALKLFENSWFWRIVRRPNVLSYKFGCEVLFEGAFMRMPNLRRLVLTGGLKPREELVKKWRRQGEGERREVKFKRGYGIWGSWWEMRNCWGFLLWAIFWVLVIFWEGEGVGGKWGVRYKPRKDKEEYEPLMVYLIGHFGF